MVYSNFLVYIALFLPTKHPEKLKQQPHHRFIVTTIKNTLDYSPRLFYWLGGEYTKSNEFEWVDGTKMSFTGWSSGDGRISNATNEPLCMGLQWKMASSPLILSNLYWAYQKCSNLGGYVCKKSRKNNFLIQNQTITGMEGRLISPDYPNQYASNIDYWIRIVAPEKSRIVVQFQKIDIEEQEECLYDYVSIQDIDFDLTSTRRDIEMAVKAPAHFPTVSDGNSVYKSEGSLVDEMHQHEPYQKFILLNNSSTSSAQSSSKSYVRWCGKHESDMAKFTFVSKTNELLFNFFTDYSIPGEGFSALWRSVDISSCPGHTFTSRVGVLTSPNYPFFLLHNLDCTYTIQAPTGRRIWIDFNEFDIANDAKLIVELGDGSQVQLQKEKHFIGDGAFVSYSDRVSIILKTGYNPQGKGFKMTYKTSTYKTMNIKLN